MGLRDERRDGAMKTVSVALDRRKVGRSMRRIAGWGVALLLLGTGCAATTLSGRSAVVPTATGTITIDPNTGETFVLAPDAPAKLTASEAMDAFLTKDPEFTLQLSDTLAIDLGYYTAPVGNGTYRFKDRLAWGYSWHRPESFSQSLPPDFPSSDTFWLFLDADTGQMLEGLWQYGA